MNICPKILPGKLWVILPYFNPFKQYDVLQNFMQCYYMISRQTSNIIAVELADGDGDLHWLVDDKHLILEKSQYSYFAKERLINCALLKLPDNCDKIMWLDADVVCLDSGWIQKICRYLENYKVIQPFKYVVRMDKANNVTSYNKRLTSGELKYGWENDSYTLGYLAAYDKAQWGQIGFAWAARRYIVEDLLLYDRCPVGAGDVLFGTAITGDFRRVYNQKSCSELSHEHYFMWAKELHKLVANSYCYMPSTIYHLWHGKVKNRKYFSTREGLVNAGFDYAYHLSENNRYLHELSYANDEINEIVRDKIIPVIEDQ